jgi:DNA ligase 1
MKELKEFVENMRATSSSLEKVEIIKGASKYIHEVLEYTYNPFKQYSVTSKTIIKKGDVGVTQSRYHYYSDLFDLLDALIKREITGHKAIFYINHFTNELQSWERDLVYKIIDKDLGIRAGDKVINKAIPNLIPTFNVALAQNFEPKLCDWSDKWFVSRKLDGVRCLAVVDDIGKCTLYSRMGKEFLTLNKVKEAIESTGVVNTVLDGEICLVDENGDEDFPSVMKELRRKNHQIENPAYMIFDMLNKAQFEDTIQSEPLEDRLHMLRSFINNKNSNNDILRYAEQMIISDDEHLADWVKLANDRGYEGIMLRKNVTYEGKRTKNLLKVKKFFDAEYEVIDFDCDEHEVVRDGKSVTMKMLANVYIEHKGYKVKVGSGFTQEQRLQYMDGSIVGKIITTQFFEETKNDKGTISLRFPTVKIVHGEKREY